MSGPYDDIINLPHHVSTTRPRMSRENRAAQFAPFAALTGYDSAIKETSRTVDKKIELDENAIEDLDHKLQMISDQLSHRHVENPEVCITHFVKDKKKSGGTYITTNSQIKKIDSFERVVVLVNGNSIKIDDILDISVINKVL